MCSLLRNLVWTISNLCRGKPRPAWDQVSEALSLLRETVHLEDEEVLVDTCWALSYLSDGDNNNIEAVLDAGVMPRVISLLSYVPLASLLCFGVCARGTAVKESIRSVIDHMHDKINASCFLYNGVWCWCRRGAVCMYMWVWCWLVFVS